MNNWIAITIGDVTGIGPEVALKAVAAEIGHGDWRYILIGDGAHLADLNLQLRLGLELPAFQTYKQPGRIAVHSPSSPLASHLPTGSPEAARAALECLRDAAQRCLRGEVAALLTAPVNKESILRSGQRFVGQTEYLSELAGNARTVMMLLGTDSSSQSRTDSVPSPPRERGWGEVESAPPRWLRVALATTHLPLRQVADTLNQAKVELAIERSAEACARLDLSRARIGVCGLNPHAGEGGQLGNEEQTIIRPAVEVSQKKRIDVTGPLPADTLFHYAFRGDYDVVVAMYHDQGLAPLKMIAFETGVNWTLGLPFIRTSPDHGTAYDIAGKGIANPSSMIAALGLAKQLAGGTR